MRTFLNRPTSIAPLAVFRVLFGFIMAVSVVRFVAMGWVTELYVEPTYYFTYAGFDWVQPFGATGMYVLFAVMGLSAAAIMLGWRYRVAAVTFFLAFTFVELIDKTNYLNHYYFVSIVSFLLIWVPANRHFSLDVRRRPELRVDTVPAWTIDIFKLQLGIVYFFAGLAKLNPDWLFEAMPLALWLPANAHLPVIGPLLAEPWAAYVFSWAGALYDLSIVFFLLWHRTRPYAYAAVVVFHLTTAMLFQIGMFPYIMILATLIYFSPAFHEGLLDRARAVGRRIGLSGLSAPEGGTYRPGRRASVALGVLFAVHFTLQLALPLRAFAYPGELFWTEEGYRFSWRVMLMEKAGAATFTVHDPASERTWQVANYEHLTPNQEKMMATQPDMILQFAHYLESYYQAQGLEDVEVFADVRVTLNGDRSRPLIDPAVDLTTVKRGPAHKAWVLPRAAPESWLTEASR